MRFTLALLASALLGQKFFADAGSNNNQWAWKNDGDLCELPKGSFERSCGNVTIEFCPNLNSVNTPCKFTADCYIDNASYNLSTHNEAFLPRAITFLGVENVNGSISHPGMNEFMRAEDTCNVECNSNPCILPSGNYINSCKWVSIHYLGWDDSDTPCLMLAECDKQMSPANILRGFGTRIHNEVLLPKGMNFSYVKNLYGKLIHPSEQFKTINDMCIEHGSTDVVTINAASMSTASKILAGSAAAATLALTL